MLKPTLFWLLGLLSFSAYSANIENITRQTLLKANKGDWTIIDVRTPKEFQQGHVPNAINIPLSEIIDNPTILESSKEKSIVLYCRSGYRAGKAAEALYKEGHKNLHHLEGDMLGWLSAELPIEE